MPRYPYQIRKLILRSAKEEFLAHGFEGASLRTICKKAGLTTGAFYSHFKQKEELFEALVDPMIAEFRGVYSNVMSRELEDLNTGVENELTSITYAIAHRDEFRLLFECSRGTRFEGFKDELIHEVFYPGYQAVFDRYAGQPVEPTLVKLILKMKFEEYMELIYGNYTQEEVKTLITQISIFSMAGFHGLLKELHTDD